MLEVHQLIGSLTGVEHFFEGKGESTVVAMQRLKLQEVHKFQDMLFQRGETLAKLPVRMSLAGVAATKESDGFVSAILMLGKFRCQELHTENIAHSWRMQKDRGGDLTEVENVDRRWQRWLSVQESIYKFASFTVTVLNCSGTPHWPDSVDDRNALAHTLQYAHHLEKDDKLLVAGLSENQDTRIEGFAATHLRNGLYLVRAAGAAELRFEGRVRAGYAFDIKGASVLYRTLPPSPGVKLYSFNVQNPYTHDIEFADESQNLQVSKATCFKPYVRAAVARVADYVIQETEKSFGTLNCVVWAIQEASDEFVFAVFDAATVHRLPLRIYSQSKERDDCLLVFGKERGVEVAATLDVGERGTGETGEEADNTSEPPLMTLSMARSGCCLHVAACHLYVKKNRVTIVEDVFRHWRLPAPSPCEIVAIMGDFNLKRAFWRQNWIWKDGAWEQQAEPHGEEPVTLLKHVRLNEEHKATEQDELPSPNDHIFLYSRDGADASGFRIVDATGEAWLSFKAATFDAENEERMNRIFSELEQCLRRTDTHLSDIVRGTWPMSDHCPLAVRLSPATHTVSQRKMH